MTKTHPLLFYGGSFDPIHQGHLDIIQGVRQWFPHAPLLISPTQHHFYKTAMASFQHRLEMIELASAELASNPIQPYPYEQKAQQAIETRSIIQHLQQEFPQHLIFVIFGMDVLNTLTDWPQWQSLLPLCNQLIIQRPPEVLSSSVKKALASSWHPTAEPHKLTRYGHICPLPLQTTPISSSDVRAWYKSNDQAHPHIPRLVDHYIQQHRLYRQP